jgi:hypothetical protein
MEPECQLLCLQKLITVAIHKKSTYAVFTNFESKGFRVTKDASIVTEQCDWFNYPKLWSSGQSSWLQIQRSWVRFPALQDFLRSSGSGTGSTQPREDN